MNNLNLRQMAEEAGSNEARWVPGKAPVAVVMISLNEEHNLEAVAENLRGWAQEVFLVDSYSKDDTVDLALKLGMHVVQRRFRSFGDQWSFALKHLPITAPWTMKLDPDERLSPELKESIVSAVRTGACEGISLTRRWWLMGRPLSIYDNVLRVWRTGKCRFSDVLVNEHPIVEGQIEHPQGYLEHLDSPDLDHWVEKQNRYSSMEAISQATKSALTEEPRLFGSSMQRRMWIKRHFYRIPFRYTALFLYFWLWKGLWRSGWEGYVGARLWTIFFFIQECKIREIRNTGRMPGKRIYGAGEPDIRVKQFE